MKLKISRNTRLLRWTIIWLLILAACGQVPEKATSFKSIFDYYKSQDGVLALSLPPGLISLVLPDSDVKMLELKNLLQELSAFRMLSVENLETNSLLKEDIHPSVTEFTYRNEFSDLFRLQNGGEDIFIRIQEKDELIKEAIIMLSSESGYFVFDLRGNISIEQFLKFAEGGYLNELSKLADFN